jgi:acyl-CoA thioester hydrolase
MPSADTYPARTDQILRYNDVDRNGHVNNAVYSTLYEAGRVEILYNPEEAIPPAGCHFSLVTITIDYLSELNWPGRVTIHTGVDRIGTSSVTFRQAIFSGKKCCSTATSTVVLTGSTTRRSTPLPPDARAYFEKLRLRESA